MPTTTAKTADEYVESLPPDRREMISAVRKVVKKNLPKGYAEGVYYGMIYYHIPLSRFPGTYNGQPLGYVGIASQKNYCSLHLVAAYGDTASLGRLRDGFARAGKKLDMGKGCVRFKRVDDLALDAIGESIAAMTPDAFIAMYEKSRLMTKAGARKAATAAAKEKTAAKSSSTPAPRTRKR
jgi:hypothetical protein